MTAPDPVGNERPGSPIGARQRYAARRQNTSCRLGAEAVVLDLTQGKYFGLDDVAARVFELLGQPRTMDELRDAIVAEYDVAADRCEADLNELLRDLIRHQLVEAVGDAPA